MGKPEKPTGPAYDELHNQYPELAWMHEWLHPRRASKKHSSGVQAAAMKLAVLAAAVAGALAVALSLRVHSTLRDVSATGADVHVRIESIRDGDLEQPFFYDLATLGDRSKAGEGALPGLDALLSLTDLEPGTEYELIYYMQNANGKPAEVGRFRFRTLSMPDKGGPGSTPKPIVVDNTPTPSATPTKSPALLEILTDSLADATERTGYSASILINNTTGKAPSFTIGGYPSGMSAAGNTLYGTPAIGTHGGYSVTVTVKAGTLTATKTLPLPVNPALLSISNEELGTYYPGNRVRGRIKTSFTPPAGLSYGISCALGGGCNASTGAFSIPIPGDAALGEYSIALSAAGGGYSAAKTITFTVKARPKPEPPAPESGDLEILYFDTSALLETGDVLGVGLQFRLKVNRAENITARLSVATLASPDPASFTFTPAMIAGDGTTGDMADMLVNRVGAHTVTLTVSYALDGVAKQKTATLELAQSRFLPGTWNNSGSIGTATFTLSGPYADFRAGGVLFEGAGYTGMWEASPFYTFTMDPCPASVPGARLFYYRHRITRSHPLGEAVTRIGEAMTQVGYSG